MEMISLQLEALKLSSGSVKLLAKNGWLLSVLPWDHQEPRNAEYYPRQRWRHMVGSRFSSCGLNCSSGKDSRAVLAQASKVRTPKAKPAEDMEKDKESLSFEEASLYRSVAMRAAY